MGFNNSTLSPSAAAVGHDSNKDVERDMSYASFDGSFAPQVRPTVTHPIAWYKDRDYFLDGWTSISIWKSAVSRENW